MYAFMLQELKKKIKNNKYLFKIFLFIFYKKIKYINSSIKNIWTKQIQKKNLFRKKVKFYLSIFYF